MRVQLELPRRARDQREIEALTPTVLPHVIEHGRQQPASSIALLHREQPQLAHRAPFRQVFIERRQPLVERERTLAANRDHARDAALVQTDHVHVVVVKPVDEPA